MKTFIKLLSPIMLLSVFSPNLSWAQTKEKIERKVEKNGTIESKTYLETDDVLKIDVDIEHDTLVALIRQFCPGWQIGDVLCGGTNPLYLDKIVAGFCFIPGWDMQPEIDPGAGVDYKFSTDSIRVALVLWKPKVSAPDEIMLAGFGTGHEDIVDALPGDHVDMAQMATHTKSFSAVHAWNQNVSKSSTYTPEEAALYADSREFDFSFLEINRYWQLATSDDYYIGNRDSFGIIVERAFSVIDIRSESAATTTEETRFRTLTARPYPPLERLPNFSSKAATARELMYHCPPGWRDLKDALLNQVGDGARYAALIGEAAVERVERENERQTLGLSLHAGSVLTEGEFDLQNLSYELGILYPFNKNFKLETLIGRYRFEAQTVDGVSVSGRYQFFLSENRDNLGLYLGAGAGLYDTPEDNQLGFIAGTGANYRFRSGRSEDLKARTGFPLQFEVGLQYQYFGPETGSELPANPVTVKLGLRYLL